MADTLSAELRAFVADPEKVADFLKWARGIPRDHEGWVAERRMADRFLALIEQYEQRLAEPPQRALEWEMARQIEALEVKLVEREAQLDRAARIVSSFAAALAAAEAQLAAVQEVRKKVTQWADTARLANNLQASQAFYAVEAELDACLRIKGTAS